MTKKKAGKPKGLIAYYRVSTRKQGIIGLGLEAQTAAVEQRAAVLGLPIVATYTEVESGKRAENRPELGKALAHAAIQNRVVRSTEHERTEGPISGDTGDLTVALHQRDRRAQHSLGSRYRRLA